MKVATTTKKDISGQTKTGSIPKKRLLDLLKPINTADFLEKRNGVRCVSRDVPAERLYCDISVATGWYKCLTTLI